MANPGRGMRLGFVEPHLARFGGIRRMIEFANRLVARGHDVTFYLPDDQILNCNWMPCDARIKTWTSGFQDELDIMRLVGAAPAYVKGPFVLEGMIQGGLGGVLALGLLWGIFHALSRDLLATSDLLGRTAIVLPPAMAALIVVGGTLVGLAGSLVSLGRLRL